MALIDVYNAETITTGSTNSWIPIIVACITAVVTLSSVWLGIWWKTNIDEKTRNKKLKREGETFETEVSLLELPLKRQVKEIEKYLKDIETGSFNTLTDMLTGRLDEMMKLNRTDIIEYYENLKIPKPKSYVINVFSGILILKDIPGSTNKILSETQPLINVQVKEYVRLMDELQDVWYKYKTTLTREQYAAQPLEDFHLLFVKYFGGGKLSIAKNIELIGTLHQDLREPKFIRREDFYVKIQEYNTKAMTVLSQMDFERKKEVFSFNIIITTIKNQYKRIYGKEMDLTDFTE